MKVYNVKTSANEYQSLYFEDSGIVDRAVDGDRCYAFDCTSVVDLWVPPSMYVLRPKRKVPNVYGIQIPGALVFDEIGVEVLQTFFEMAGELLPVNTKTGTMHLLNVLECLNCLDHENSTWLMSLDGSHRLYPLKYVFDPDRFGASTLFKIPEVCQAHIMTLEREGDPESEFKAAVEHSGLKGFEFDLIWEE